MLSSSTFLLGERELDVVRAYIGRWQSSLHSPDLRAFIVETSNPAREVVRELVLVDFVCRLKSDLADTVEAQLNRFPEFRDDVNFVLELIDLEIRFSNAKVDEADYIARFPQLAAALRDQFKIRRDFPSGAPTPRVWEKHIELEERPPVLAGYDILGAKPLGKGGMGTVWRARDHRFRRSLAVKVLSARHRRDAALRLRFKQEALLMGQLQHPGVPPVHDMGELPDPDSRPFLVMKLVRGRKTASTNPTDEETFDQAPTLKDLLAARANPKQDLPRFLAIFEQICATLAYAHAQGVIHRDLKPANIMIGAFDEVQVLDWGLAKLVAADPAQTTRHEVGSTIFSVDKPADLSDGLALGTLQYMAPEQLSGNASDVDQRTDVFGLGAILCEILTGNPPYLGEARMVFGMVRSGNLQPAYDRLADGDTDRELIEQAKRMLSPEQSNRPNDAGAVTMSIAKYQADLQHRLKQAEIDRAAAQTRAEEEQKRRVVEQARADEESERRKAEQAKTQEERKRRRMTVAFAALLIVFLATGSAGGLWYFHDQAERAEEEQRQAKVKAANDKIEADEKAARIAKQTALLDKARNLFQEALALRTQAEHARGSQALTLVLRAQTAADAAASICDDLGNQGLVAEITALRGSLKNKERNLQFITRIEQARLFPSTKYDADRYDWTTIDGVYSAAFAQRGVDVNSQASSAVAAKLKESESLADVIEALDYWAASIPNTPKAKKLREIAMAIDKDETRRAIRTAVLANDHTLLKKLADNKHLSSLATPTIVLLGEALRHAKAFNESERVLLLAYQRAPSDFWTNNELFHLYTSLTPPKREEALRHATACLSLQPSNPLTHLNVGWLLGEMGRHVAAEPYFAAAIKLDSESSLSLAWNNMGWILNERKRYKDAVPFLEKAIEIDGSNAMAYTNLGDALWELGDKAGAEKAIRKATEANPRYDRAFANLGWVLIEKKEYKEAKEILETAVRINSQNGWARNMLGDVLWELGEKKAAILCYRDAIKENQRNTDAYLKLADVLKTQKPADAVAVLNELIKVEPKNGEGNRQLGVLLADAKKFTEAIPKLKLAVEVNPEDQYALSYLGFSLVSEEQYREAIPYLRRAVELNAEDQAAHANLGEALYEEDFYTEAVPILRKVIAWDTKNQAAFLQLGHSLSNLGKYIEAKTHLQRAVELDVDDDTALSYLGECHFHLNEYTQAIPILERALKIEPDYKPDLKYLGMCYWLTGKLKESAQVFEKYIKLDSSDVLVQATLGTIHENLGNHQKAIELLQAAAKQNPKNGLIHAQLGNSMVQANRFDEAIKSLERAKELGVTTLELHNKLGWSYRQVRAFEKAIQSYEAAMRLDPKNTWTLNQLGIAHIEFERPDAAIPLFEKSLKEDAKNADAHAGIGMALLQMKKFKAAIDRFRTALDIEPNNVDAHQNLLAALTALGRNRDAVTAVRVARKVLTQEQWPVVRYNAACAFVLAGCGREDAAKLTDSEKLDLRNEARKWLREDLKAWTDQAEKAHAAERIQIADTIRHVLTDEDFRGVRDMKALASLDKAERQDWLDLWSDFGALLKRVQSK